MALQTSGAISLNDIHIEAEGSSVSGTTASINDTTIRNLNPAAGKTINTTSGTEIDFNNFYGATSVTEIVIPTGTSNRTILKYATENLSGYGGSTVYGYAYADGSSISGSGITGSLGFGNVNFAQIYANSGRTDGIYSYNGGGLVIAFALPGGGELTLNPSEMNFSRVDVNRTASTDPSYGSYGPAASYYLSSATITHYGGPSITMMSWSSPQAMGKTGGGIYGNANASPNHTFVFV